jgi:hypothetical protein
MDRTLKVYSKTGHLFAEFIFSYNHPKEASVHYIEYRRLYNDDEEDENKSVYPSMESDRRLDFRKFKSIDEIKAYDKEIVKREMSHYMKDPVTSYKFEYDADPVLLRYIVANWRDTIGMVNVRFSFINNTKEVKFLSATNPRFDFDITSDSLESNVECIVRIPLYQEREEPREISSHDLKRLEPWY